MNLGSLLSLLRETILNDRSDRIAGTADYLWSDQVLVTFIDEAQRRFARKGLVLRDASTPAVTVVSLLAGVTEYVLHPSVLAVISAQRSDQAADLSRVGHSLLNAYRAPTENWVDPQTITTLQPGPPLAYSTDEEVSVDTEGSLSNVTLRIYPAPRLADETKTIRLRVVRKPIANLSPNDLDAVPEIPEDHHIEMLDWAAYLALRIVDDDAGAPRRAAEFAASFEAHVKEARNQAMRKMSAPLMWGFGRGGFTWSS